MSVLGRFTSIPWINNGDKIGRNDPCPEGCGIKYKKCGIDDRCIKISETK